MKNHKKELDLSSVDLDGSHTPEIREGTEVEYHGRKKRKSVPTLGWIVFVLF